ncbi:MAG: phenylacetate-CoA oxygenase subunit PaaJ [Ilumatobacter sp.]|uniref:1,2-phenylacetyl-CoA epoxidase subunit PaaD n=1 Tax=Ilumatobacter sp. TaxID=1967498 RepID=UPI00262D259A|nr:1,2-phenylacetyl-CoA epoxidase subunit PaaD [Ilumatobacter sp.]MDJ0767799.1 phenylacetate-CoA oxygenase subunit PaaJ [Ilumatobacter sp.]
MIDAQGLDELVRDIEDPELPHVTIGDLGIVRDVTIDHGTATVLLTPTYTGCPATDQIRDDVTTVVRDAGYEPDVRLVMSPAWSTDWISERGRERLRLAGIAPPSPVADQGATPVEPPVACPRCGSRRSRLISEFGATACKAAYVCEACSEPFEHFKPL